MNSKQCFVSNNKWVVIIENNLKFLKKSNLLYYFDNLFAKNTFRRSLCLLFCLKRNKKIGSGNNELIRYSTFLRSGIAVWAFNQFIN